MIDPANIHSLTDFQRNTRAALKRLRRTGRPEILTVNGKAAVVVQDAAAFGEMIRGLENAYTIEAVRVGIEQMKAGKTLPLEDVAKEIRAGSRPSKTRRRTA